jgi:hypothetical protein
MPMHSGPGKSGMMACCKTALEQSGVPRVAVARLCCAMNCSEPSSTNVNVGQNFSQTIAPLSEAIVLSLPAVTDANARVRDYSRNTSIGKEPAYLLNLALLI